VGRSYLLAGQRKKAEELFAMARARDPKEGDVHRIIMAAWIRAGQRVEALKALEEMQLMDPKAHRAFARGAIDLLEGGLDRQAEDLMERAWALEPKEWEPCVAFARAAMRRKRSDLAARWCSRAAIAKPQEEKLWKELAQVFAEGGAEPR
jgi:tetratricopeptide (TPR) repeat protein